MNIYVAIYGYVWYNKKIGGMCHEINSLVCQPNSEQFFVERRKGICSKSNQRMAAISR